MAEEEKPKKKMEISDEERQRRSEAARKLHKEGKFGGAQRGQGRKKKARAQELVAEKIKEDGEKIYKALMSALRADSDATKLKAAIALLDIETKETELQIKEEQRQYNNMDREKMIELMTKKMKQLEAAGVDVQGMLIAKAKGPQVIDVDGVEVERPE